jgi:hypothetical protein
MTATTNAMTSSRLTSRVIGFAVAIAERCDPFLSRRLSLGDVVAVLSLQALSLFGLVVYLGSLVHGLAKRLPYRRVEDEVGVDRIAGQNRKQNAVAMLRYRKARRDYAVGAG